MKQNEYDPAEAIEIGKAEEIILGWKDLPTDLDATVNPPYDRLYVEEASNLARTGLTRDIKV